MSNPDTQNAQNCSDLINEPEPFSPNEDGALAEIASLKSRNKNFN
jgi:hypothetical protein